MNNNKLLKKITVLKNLTQNETFRAFMLSHKKPDEEFISLVLSNGAEENFCTWLQNLILYNENAFSTLCAQRKTPSDYLIKALIKDLDIIFNKIRAINANNTFFMGNFSFPFIFDNAKLTVKNLCEYYAKYGYGDFIKYIAFNYSNERLIPIANVSNIKLNSLKGYKTEKKLIENNLLNFLDNLPYSHMLLYGDKGTGKSSTIHAFLNEYRDKGLKLIQLTKENLPSLSNLTQKLTENPLKFILLLDDLSLDERDANVSTLKAALEGNIAVIPSNVMIIATSNRRHILKENFSDRSDSVHASDSINEQLSLSDRFGLSILFSTTDKVQYLSIVEQLAADYNLAYNEKLRNLAEQWAIVKGERSPRRAKQFIDAFYASMKRNTKIMF